MSKRTILIAMLGATALALPAAVGLAGPASKPLPAKPGARASKEPGDSMHVTVTAGKGRLGVSVLEISPELRVHFAAPRDRGVLVNTVRPDSPAARAGILVGDVLTEVDGEAVDSASNVLEAMSDRKKGDTVAIELVRSGRPTTAQVRLEDDPTWQGGSGSFGFEGDRFADPDALARGMAKGFRPFGDPSLRRDVEHLKEQIDALQRRLERLEKPR